MFRAFLHDESGQSLIFGVLSVFFVLFFAAMVLGVGRVATRRVQMQHAADAAAYAAAAVESECLNLIAATNTAMARVRGQAMRYVADAYAYGVLNALREKILPARDEITELEQERTMLLERLEDEELSEAQRQVYEDAIVRIDARIELLEEVFAGDAPHSDADPDPWWIVDVVGVNRADLRFAEASEQAQVWANEAGEWYRRLSHLQNTVAILAPHLASEAAYRTATRLGAYYASIFPASRWFPRPDRYLQVRAERPAENWWIVEGGGERISVERIPRSEALSETGRSGFCAAFQRAWRIEWRRGVDSARYVVAELEGRQWYWENLDTRQSACIQQTEEYRVITWGPGNINVIGYDGFEALVNTDGVWPRNTTFVRWRDGALERAHPPADAEQDWEPEEHDFAPLEPVVITIDGVNVALSMDPVIPLPGQAEIRVLDPWHIDLTNAAGDRWARVHLREGRTYLTAEINRTHVRVHEGRAAFRRRGQELWTHNEIGHWHSHFDIEDRYWWQHRLTPNDARTFWLYEYEEEGGRLKKESNVVRLAAHHATGGVVSGGSDGWTDADVLPDWLHEAEHRPHGWYSVRTGEPVRAVPEDDYIYHGLPVDLSASNADRYHQVRLCWEPHCEDGYLPPPEDDEGAEPEPCPVCEGRAYVLVHAGEVELPELALGFLDNEDWAPLVLDEEFVKHGVTVGVWSPRESHFSAGSAGNRPDRPVEYLLHDPEAGMRGVLRGGGATPRQRGERLRPAWGYFAVAAARPRLLAAPDSPAEPGAMQHGWFFSERAVEMGERDRWLDDSMWNLYLVQSGAAWSRWDAALVPFNRQLLDADIRELIGAETGTGWLLERIAYGSPGGVARTRHTDTPSWWGWERHYGDVSGWVHNIYGGFDQHYPPGRVREYLLNRMRPRLPYPAMGPSHIDARDGTLRDPLMEYLAEIDGERRGGQLEYNRLRDDHVQH